MGALSKLIQKASLNDCGLVGQPTFAVVVEGALRKLLLVGALQSEQEQAVEGLAVLEDGDLRNQVRQVHALQSVGDSRVALDPGLETTDGVLKPRRVRKHHLTLEGIDHPLETS